MGKGRSEINSSRARARAPAHTITTGLVCPIGAGAAWGSSAGYGGENSAAVEKREAPIEEARVRTTKCGEHAVVIVGEQSAGIVNGEGNCIVDAVDASVLRREIRRR